MVRNPASVGDVRDVCSVPGWGRAPGGGKATHSRMLPWEIPWTEEPGGLQSVGSKGVGYDVVTKPPSPLRVIRNHHGLD